MFRFLYFSGLVRRNSFVNVVVAVCEFCEMIVVIRLFAWLKVAKSGLNAGFRYLFSGFSFLNVEDAGGGMVFGGGKWAELFCFSVVGRGGRASVWGLVGGKVMLSGVFSCFFLAYWVECRTFEAVFERI